MKLIKSKFLLLSHMIELFLAVSHHLKVQINIKILLNWTVKNLLQQTQITNKKYNAKYF